ncbi:MAG TPA: hypothetical protein VFK04_07215 [Gemmatimonadaceae bacterium]|nr:hypothetical protein [Gemmatimonadaceae bacterium]
MRVFRFAIVSINRLHAAALVALSLVFASSAASAQTIAPLYIARAKLAPAVAPPLALLTAPAAPALHVSSLSPSRAPVDEEDAERPGTHFKTRFVLGFISSILAHEAGHVAASYAVGGRPSFGFDKGRPTVYSGIDANLEPHKQFIFSSAGLTVQTLMDELILDIPHHRGGAFERGLLAGGIATTAFYITIGRSASVSDVTFMARTSSLSKTQVSLIFGAIAASHVLRIHFDDHYAHFFAAPSERGALKVGMVVK